MAVTPLPVPEPADAEVLEIDVNSLTWGEVEQIEEVVGRDVMRELGRGTPSVKTLLALVFVVKRRTDPEFTMDDARAMKVSAIRTEADLDPKENGA